MANNRITIEQAEQLEQEGKLDSISAKFMTRGKKQQEFYDTVSEALEYKDDPDLYGSFWVSRNDVDGFFELTDNEGNVL